MVERCCYSYSAHNLSSLLVCTNMDGCLSSFCVACRMSTDWIDNCTKLPSSSGSSTTTSHPTRSVSQRNSTCNGVAGGRTHISVHKIFGDVHHMLLNSKFHAKTSDALKSAAVKSGQPAAPPLQTVPYRQMVHRVVSRKSGDRQLELKKRRRAR